MRPLKALQGLNGLLRSLGGPWGLYKALQGVIRIERPPGTSYCTSIVRDGQLAALFLLSGAIGFAPVFFLTDFENILVNPFWYQTGFTKLFSKSANKMTFFETAPVSRDRQGSRSANWKGSILHSFFLLTQLANIDRGRDLLTGAVSQEVVF